MKFNRAEYMRRYRQKNQDKIKAYQQAYEKVNRASRRLQKKLSDQKYRQTHQKKIMARQRTPKRRWQEAKYAATRRGISFNLSLAYFTTEIAKSCYYCRNELGKASETGCGLDRLNNAQGYEEGNVVSCCAFCNLTKGDRLTAKEMRVVANTLLHLRK